ncbi:MAG TPA: branched-chain amino acid ABC transporter substrate-binding protein [Solirubrobacteraceae bacterium]|nr:branched-chain amino acid ABC transporter substrate-binding protein [Solirubrobacteraceae bacterium]
MAASSSAKTASTAAASQVDFYSSLPLSGSSTAQTIPLVNGIKLALSQAGNKAGKYTIKYSSLNDATAAAGQWDPSQTAANARKAAEDPKAVYYMGEFNSGASEVSAPILNEGGIAQDSPANTYVGLTASLAGVTAAGEPQKYMPSGKHTYTRIVPIDTIQGAADLLALKQTGCTKLAVFDDTQAYGAGLAAVLKAEASMYGMSVVYLGSDATVEANYTSVASNIASSGAQCVELSATTSSVGGAAFASAVHAALPNAVVLGPDGMCSSAWTTSFQVLCTVATLDLKAYPGGRTFLTAYKKAYHNGNPDPYSIYGYASADLGLNALSKLKGGLSGKALQAAFVKALFATKNLKSVLGTYSITPTGDTTLTSYGLYKLNGGTLTFYKTLHPSKYLKPKA